ITEPPCDVMTRQTSSEIVVPEFKGPGGQVDRAAASFDVRIIRDWDVASALWNEDSSGTSFQHRHWLDAWYRAFDAVSPLIVLLTDKITGRDVALVPLICRKHRDLRVIEFADLGVSDYNAPLLASVTPNDSASMRAIGEAILSALQNLPDRPDLIRLKKMPAEIGGRPNPLIACGTAGYSSLNGNLIATGDDFELYRASIKKMQLSRCWRVFTRQPGTTFRIAATVDDALHLMAAMDAQQRKRMKKLGHRFELDEPRHAKFYRDVVGRGLLDGYVVVSALLCNDEIVAATMGLRQGSHYSLLRTSNAGGQWSNCSPGLLCVERTMAALHQCGVRHFDLSIGNYDYKRRFGARRLPLMDVSVAFSWRGVPYALRDRAAQRLRRHPRLARSVRRALGRLARPKVILNETLDHRDTPG
ncbi:MAG TPA: GNAT family N-acetyltransferase, partial [Bradyrhizobium sp.]|nr:GNAT family N-acetyltransferase [Bradyrhizobium sp.]